MQHVSPEIQTVRLFIYLPGAGCSNFKAQLGLDLGPILTYCFGLCISAAQFISKL